jgi:glycosyltransferase involved in cell wall biosynthesis
MKIAHIITGLGNGGAESNLYKICMYDQHNKHHVISLMDMGKYGKLLKKKGIDVSFLNMEKGYFSIFKFLKLVKILKKINPNVIQTWMYHSDLLGSLAAILAGNKKIIWNIRNSNILNNDFKRSFVIWMSSKLSWFIPRKIISCSKKSINIHCKLGYCPDKFVYIPNGYDFNYLKPLKNINKIQKKFHIIKSTPLIGMVARYHPQKDHKTLIESLCYLKNKNIKFLCVLIGPGVNNQNKNLINTIKKYKIEKFIKLLGESNDIIKVMSELDIHILSSAYGEAFSNVVIEAMACETPSVVTDVGDLKFIVNKFGWVAKPHNHINLSKQINQALEELKKKNWKEKCKNARLHVMQKFSIRKMIFMYNRIWKKNA